MKWMKMAGGETAHSDPLSLMVFVLFKPWQYYSHFFLVSRVNQIIFK